jgi:hypothetical protein
MGTITAIGQAIAAVFGWITGRSAARNSPQMQENAAAKTNTKLADKATHDVAEGDIDEIRKDVS